MKDKMAEVEEQPAAAANGNGAHTVDSEVYNFWRFLPPWQLFGTFL